MNPLIIQKEKITKIALMILLRVNPFVITVFF